MKIEKSSRNKNKEGNTKASKKEKTPRAALTLHTDRRCHRRHTIHCSTASQVGKHEGSLYVTSGWCGRRRQRQVEKARWRSSAGRRCLLSAFLPSCDLLRSPHLARTTQNDRVDRWIGKQTGGQVAGSSLIHTAWIADVLHA